MTFRAPLPRRPRRRRFHVHEARQIFETLGLNDAYKTHHTLSQIAEAWGDSAAAAEWARKCDAKLLIFS